MFEEMPKSFNYQVSDLADSFSLPSEPHDIRNWFLSYAYESPQSNTYDEDRTDSALRVTDDVEVTVDDGERGKEKVAEENKLDEATLIQDKSIPGEIDSRRSTNTSPDCDYRKVREVSESHSFPSEPPDIGNWFSSYAYESPKLNTHENFDDSEQGKQGREEKKPERTAADKHKLVDVNHTKADEVLHSESDCLSFSPEPPHVEGWFSSYKNESPSLDTSIDFTDSESQCIECDGVGNCAKKSGGKDCNLENLTSFSERNKLPTSEKFILCGLANCSNVMKDTNSQLHWIDKALNDVEDSRSDIIHLPTKKSMEHILKVNPPQDQNIPSSLARKRDLDSKDFISIKLLANASSSKSRKPLENGQEDGLVQSPFVSNVKENEENSSLGNGFVSTRKERSEIRSGKSSLKRPVDVPLVVNKENFLKRKPLSEKTNFQHYDGLEITGKWKCPQKRKPNPGPPLKQLRLEQWVNRM